MWEPEPRPWKTNTQKLVWGITAEALKTHDPLGPVFEEFLQTDQSLGLLDDAELFQTRIFIHWIYYSMNSMFVFFYHDPFVLVFPFLLFLLTVSWLFGLVHGWNRFFRKPFESLVEEEQPDVIVTDYASGAPFEVCKEKKIPLVLNAALPGVLVSWMVFDGGGNLKLCIPVQQALQGVTLDA